MEFEWDPSKNKRNVEKHGISFEEAIEIFNLPVLTYEDKRRDYGERRFISIGLLIDTVIITVIHTDRNRKIRVISARKADHSERRDYYDYLKT